MKVINVLPIYIVTLILLVGVSQAYVISFQNLNDTDIILHPSQSFAYYHVNTSLKSTTPVIIESKYIYISGTPVEFKPSVPTDFYLNTFNPEYISEPDTVLFNFTVSTDYHEQDITFYFGNLSGKTLIVYKDGNPWYIGIANKPYIFKGNTTSIINYEVFTFSDGLGIRNSVLESNEPIANISNYSEGTIINISGIVSGIDYDYELDATYLLVSDSTGYTLVFITGYVPININDTVNVTGVVSINNTVIADYLYIGEISTGFSNHTYVIKTLPSSAVTSPYLLIAPALPTFPYITEPGTISYLIAILLIGGLLYIAYRRFRS